MENASRNFKQALRSELAVRWHASSIMVGLVACFVYFYAFNSVEYILLIRMCALGVILLSAFRVQIVGRLLNEESISDSRWNLLKGLICLNSILWGVIFIVAALEHRLSGVHFIVIITMICGLTSGSLITLSGNLHLFSVYQISLLGPLLVVIGYDWLNGNQFGAVHLFFPIGIYLCYQLYQAILFRRRIVENINFRSELERTNQELRESQAAQLKQTEKFIHTARLAALGEMAAGIAHEVNNPLAIVSGCLEQIQRKVGVCPQSANCLEVVKLTDRSTRGVDRISKIINGLRMFSRQSEHLPKTKVSLKQIMDDTLNFCGEVFKARCVRLEVGPYTDVNLECQPVQISQVLINLIKNAEDALVANKDESQRWIKLTFEEYGDMLLIHVSNGGPKIPMDVQEKLFLPFFTTKEVGKGTGLGLSISRGIMVEHEGDLVFNESAPQTTFTMVIPILFKE